MKRLGIFAFFALLPTCCIASDPRIHALVVELSSPERAAMWGNGMFSPLDLSSKAAPAKVTASFLRTSAFDKGPVKRYKIRSTEPVMIHGHKYTAVLIETEQGDKVILMSYDILTNGKGKRIGGQWWTTAYDVE